MSRSTVLTAALATVMALASSSFAGDLVIHPGDAAFGSGNMRLEPNTTFAPPPLYGSLPPVDAAKNSEGRAQYNAIASYVLGNGCLLYTSPSPRDS